MIKPFGYVSKAAADTLKDGLSAAIFPDRDGYASIALYAEAVAVDLQGEAPMTREQIEALSETDEAAARIIDRSAPGKGRAIVLAGKAMYEAVLGPDAYANSTEPKRAHYRFLATLALKALDAGSTAGVTAEPLETVAQRIRAALAAKKSVSASDVRAILGDPLVGVTALARPKGEPVAFQQRVAPWMEQCFGAEISGDRLERGDRLLEEVLELLQSGDYPKNRVAELTDYVFGRERGEPDQEVGGVMTTLAAYCLAHGLDMHAAGETELARIWTKIDKIRAKQAAKPTGSALPVANPPADSGGLRSAAQAVYDWWHQDVQDDSPELHELFVALGGALKGEPNARG